MPQPERDRIAVVDVGGQYAHVIATKVRRQRVLAEIRQPEDPNPLAAEALTPDGKRFLMASPQGGARTPRR